MVSIIMPCYNDGAYIEEAVASVRAQTYENIELIIIDDGSDDPKTLEILQKMCAEGVTVLHTDHLRPAGARNAGIAAAKGTYILPVDSDDTIEAEYVARAVEVMESSENIGIVYCHADLFGEETGPWVLPEYSLEAILLDNVIFVTALFRREDWEKVGGFRTTMKHGMEDYDFWLSILELGRDVYQLPETFFHYRIKPASRTTRFMDDPAVVRETYRDIYRQHPVLYDRYRDEYAMVLRDALIDLIFMNRTYKKIVSILNKLRQIPLLRKVVHKFILK